MDVSVIFKYFSYLSELQKSQIEKLGPLYQQWNEKINVISRKDIDSLFERHVLHSLAIAKFVQFIPGSKVLDVGTGGGFPGIPLAILFPDVTFHLVDSIGKKIKVCEEISGEIGLTNITFEHGRMEKVKGEFDFIVSRAVAPTSQLNNWTRKLLRSESQNELSSGWLLLKGGDLEDELATIKLQKTIVPISDYFEESFFGTKKVVYLNGGLSS